MSMGMFMLPPAMISLPFKLLLFVLVDGWSLVVQSLVTSFRAECLTLSSPISLATPSCSPCSIAAPMLLVALLVGLTVSVLQAVTQIQEQTLVVRAEAPRRRASMFLLALRGSCSSW